MTNEEREARLGEYNGKTAEVTYDHNGVKFRVKGEVIVLAFPADTIVRDGENFVRFNRRYLRVAFNGNSIHFSS